MKGGYGPGAILGALLGLVGCASAPPPAVYYSPVPSLPALPEVPWDEPILPGVLLVRRPQADALLNGRFLAWRAAPDDPTMGVYNRHLWSIAPPEQLQTYLQRCLAKAGVADAVVLPQQPLRPDWQLDGQLTHFEQQLTGPMDTPNNARFFLAAELTLAPQTPGISTPPKVWRAQPQVAIPLADADPNRIAVGLEEALTQFCRQVVGQLTAAFPEGADS